MSFYKNLLVYIKLFKKAIEIVTNNRRCNKGYIKGILKQWKSL